MKYYSEKQSYWAGYFLAERDCQSLTSHASLVDFYPDRLPKGFNWKSFHKGFVGGFNSMKASKLLANDLDSDNEVEYNPSEFARKMLNAVDTALGEPAFN